MNRRHFIIILIGIIFGIKNRTKSFIFRNRHIPESELKMDRDLPG